MRRHFTILMSIVALVTILSMLPLAGCGKPAQPPATQTPPPTTTPTVLVPELLPTTTPAITETTPASENTTKQVFLTPNPVETSDPQYGGTIRFGQSIPTTFDGHQKVAYGPVVTLPTFNQLVTFNLDYKETVPENITGDLADSWETSPDGTEITFHLHPGVKWHDAVPFTADDVVYSLEKMIDPQRSAISASFPAYQSAEKIDDNTVKVHLKYPSAGFLVALASGDAVIQAKHLAGTDPQSPEFMVGTGPFKLDDYKVRIHMKWQRNPDYWKKDKNGNQLPYLDGIQFFQTGNVGSNDMLIARQLDLKNPVTGAGTLDTYQTLKSGAPDLLWQRRDRPDGDLMFLNLSAGPLSDIRVRQAMALVIDENDLIIGSAQDPMFGITDVGILPPPFGLPKDEVLKLLGWDKPMPERISKAQQLMAEAGYADGFKLTMMSFGSAASSAGINTVYADALRKHLKINSEVLALTTPEVTQRLANGNYGLYTTIVYAGQDPLQLTTYFGTNGSGNAAHYSNPDLNKKLADLDRVLDPDKRREAIWDIERLLLTELPALPTGTFIANIMPYYNWVKNIRWNLTSYSNVCRFEDVWIDKSVANQSAVAEATPTPTPPPTTAPPSSDNTSTSGTTAPSYDRPDIPILWLSIDPPEAQAHTDARVTVKMQVPAGAYVYLVYYLPQSGTRSTYSHDEKIAGADGIVTMSFAIHHDVLDGEGKLQAEVRLADGSTVIVSQPYFNR